MIPLLSETEKIDGPVVRDGDSLADEEGALGVEALAAERDPRGPVARPLGEDAVPGKAGRGRARMQDSNDAAGAAGKARRASDFPVGRDPAGRNGPNGLLYRASFR
jgi:hypothetical protein